MAVPVARPRTAPPPAAGRPRTAAALVKAALAFLVLGIGPCGPLPGGELAGTTQSAIALTDWSTTGVDAVEHCQVEVRPGEPHSVTVNCFTRDGRLYVSCSECAGKSWSAWALADPRGRIRIGEVVYPVLLRRAGDPAELDAAWRARARKTGAEPEPRPGHWWTFELTGR